MSGSIQQSFHFNSKESQLIQRECVLITSEYSLKGIICSYCVAAKKIKVWFWCKIKKLDINVFWVDLRDYIRFWTF